MGANRSTSNPASRLIFIAGATGSAGPCQSYETVALPLSYTGKVFDFNYLPDSATAARRSRSHPPSQ